MTRVFIIEKEKKARDWSYTAPRQEMSEPSELEETGKNCIDNHRAFGGNVTLRYFDFILQTSGS